MEFLCTREAPLTSAGIPKYSTLGGPILAKENRHLTQTFFERIYVRSYFSGLTDLFLRCN